MSYFRSKIAVVTGGASGIGRALSAELAREGARVMVTDIDGAGAERAAEEIRRGGGQARAAALDVARADDVARIVEGVVAEDGRIDLLFNNAGIAISSEVRDMSLAQWRRIIDINLLGVVHGVHAAYPHMVRQGSGHIVNTASLAGLIPSAMLAAYSATKHGVVGLSAALRMEAADLGVRVSVLCPGFVQTGIYEASEYNRVDREAVQGRLPFKMISADACARATLHAMARNEFIITMPAYATALHWLQRLLPGATLRVGVKMVRDFRPLRRE